MLHQWICLLLWLRDFQIGHHHSNPPQYVSVFLTIMNDAHTWVETSHSRGTSKNLPQQRRVFFSIFNKYVLQSFSPVQLIEDYSGCKTQKGNKVSVLRIWRWKAGWCLLSFQSRHKASMKIYGHDCSDLLLMYLWSQISAERLSLGIPCLPCWGQCHQFHHNRVLPQGMFLIKYKHMQANQHTPKHETRHISRLSEKFPSFKKIIWGWL